MKKFGAVLVGITVVGSLILNASISRGDSAAAITYLKSKPVSAWTAMALIAAGESPSLENLKSVSAAKAIEFEAPILALTAAGKDPRTFGSADLVAGLKAFYDGTQLGDAGTLNDDVFGLLALLSAGEPKTSTTTAGIAQFLRAHENTDGGWGFATNGTSDTNTTAAAIMALVADGASSADSAITNAVSYLKQAQNPDGGFPYDPRSQWGTDSDASSDAWVILAIRSAGQDPASWTRNGKSPLDHLQTLQAASGAFIYQPGSGEDAFTPTTTSYAVLALSGKTLPLQVITPEGEIPKHFSYRLEGQTQELCAGEADGLTALDAIKSAASACGLTYHLAQASFGSYVDEIATEKAAGTAGWLYFVDNALPSVGADAYALHTSDEVLWYYGEYGASPLRLSGATSTSAGTALTGLVEAFSGGVWKPLANAVVSGANASTTTDDSGKFSLALPSGIQSVYAEKTGSVRSNTLKVTVGASEEASLDLSVVLSTSSASGSENAGGSGGGSHTAISLVVDTGSAGNSSLDFGTAKKGATPKKDLVLKNQGQEKIYMESTVTGDEVFRSYLALDGRTWKLYHATVLPGAQASPEITLPIPPAYSGSGLKKGSLIFWATPTQ